MRAAQYRTLAAQALHADPHTILWHVSLTAGWSAIHTRGIQDGGAYIWPDPRLSAAGRDMLRIKQKREQFRLGLWRPKVDL